MSPDSPTPSTQRKAWRIMSATAAVLAAASMFVSVWLYTQIQDSRKDNVRDQCIAQNARHDRLEAAFTRLYDRPANAREAARRALLINAVAPKRDCEQRVDRLFDGSTP